MTRKRQPYKTYTKEFKLEAVKLMRESAKHKARGQVLNCEFSGSSCKCKIQDLTPCFPVNAKWVDAAVARGDDIVVVSDKRYMFRTDGSLTGFGKEVQRFITVHNYRWSADSKKLLPPSNNI